MKYKTIQTLMLPDSEEENYGLYYQGTEGVRLLGGARTGWQERATATGMDRPEQAALRDRLEQFLRNVQKEYGYQQVITPHIGNKELYVTSGHYAKYGKDSFQPIHTPIEGEEYLLKPMN